MSDDVIEFGKDQTLRTEEMFRFIGGGMSPVKIPVMLVKFRNEFRPAR